MSPDNVQVETFCELSLVDGGCITLDLRWTPDFGPGAKFVRGACSE
jgi:hypothetical protein